MRVASHAYEQYRRTSELAQRETQDKREKSETRAQVRTTATSFGFSLGKFGVRFEKESTQLDPSLSRDVRKERQKRRAFETESEVENLRAAVGRNGAVFRDNQYGGHGAAVGFSSPSVNRVRQAMTAYADAQRRDLPPPGAMLAGVV